MTPPAPSDPAPSDPAPSDPPPPGPQYAPQWAPPPRPPFEIGDAFSWAWRQFRRHQKVFVVGALPLLVLSIALYAYYIAEFLLGDSISTGSTDELVDYYQRLGVFTLASIVMTLPLSILAANLLRAALIVADGGTPTIGTLYSLRRVGRILVTVVVIGVVTLVGMLLCLLPGLFSEAIESGYRLLDTAKSYGNEIEVGRGIAQSSVPRDELFVTTKLPGADHGRHTARATLEGSLERLGLDHVDLYLIHWPLPRLEQYVQTWEAFVELRDAGLARSIGVSNFLPEHLDHVIAATDVTPAVNQVELHPYFPQAEQRATHERLGIVTQSWTPLGRGTGLLDEPVLREVADKHGLTPGQVVLRWHTQVGTAPIPKSATPERFRSNLAIFDATLDDGDLEAIAGLDNGHRIGGDPAVHEE